MISVLVLVMSQHTPTILLPKGTHYQQVALDEKKILHNIPRSHNIPHLLSYPFLSFSLQKSILYRTIDVCTPPFPLSSHLIYMYGVLHVRTSIRRYESGALYFTFPLSLSSRLRSLSHSNPSFVTRRQASVRVGSCVCTYT